MNSVVVALVSCLICFGGGFYSGIQWQKGKEAIALNKARDDLKAQEKVSADIALIHAANTAALNRQLGNQRVKLRDLTSGRDCLSADAVGVLNGPGAGVPGTATQPAGTAGASATDQDVGDALAICRGEYAKVADQLNRIIDIEESRR